MYAWALLTHDLTYVIEIIKAIAAGDTRNIFVDKILHGVRIEGNFFTSSSKPHDGQGNMVIMGTTKRNKT